MTAVHFDPDRQSSWAAGDSGTILLTQDGGATWHLQPSNTQKNLAAVHFADDRSGWAVGDDGMIMAIQDAGAIWQVQPSGASKNLRC